jgi:hypothetical protein
MSLRSLAINCPRLVHMVGVAYRLFFGKEYETDTAVNGIVGS